MDTGRVRPAVERLDRRDVPAVTAGFAAGVLTVTGDAAANSIVVAARRVAPPFVDEVFVTADGAEVPVAGGNPNPADFASYQRVVVAAGGGNDTVVVESAAVPLSGQTVALGGGAGDDALTSTSFNPAALDGGPGNDTLTGGGGADTYTGGAGADLIVLNPSPGDDVIDGGSGRDTVRANGREIFRGAPGNDRFDLDAGPGGRLALSTLQGPDGTATASVGGVEAVDIRTGLGADFVRLGDLSGVAALRSVVVSGGDGNDTVTAAEQASPLVALVADGGAGDDTLAGGAGLNVLLGGDGNDRLTAGSGLSVFVGGAGSDTFDRAGRPGVIVLDLGPDDTLI